MNWLNHKGTISQNFFNSSPSLSHDEMLLYCLWLQKTKQVAGKPLELGAENIFFVKVVGCSFAKYNEAREAKSKPNKVTDAFPYNTQMMWKEFSIFILFFIFLVRSCFGKRDFVEFVHPKYNRGRNSYIFLFLIGWKIHRKTFWKCFSIVGRIFLSFERG